MSRVTRLTRYGVAVLLLPLVVSCATTSAAAPAAQSKPSGQQGGQRQIAVPVDTKTVEKGSIASILTYSGNIQSRANVNVLPRATGRIDKLYVDVGDAVKAGDTIAVLDRTQLDAQVRQAEGALRSARPSRPRGRGARGRRPPAAGRAAGARAPGVPPTAPPHRFIHFCSAYQ